MDEVCLHIGVGLGLGLGSGLGEGEGGGFGVGVGSGLGGFKFLKNYLCLQFHIPKTDLYLLHLDLLYILIMYS